MNPDVVNGMFELTGAALTWLNVVRVLKDKGYAGIHPAAVGFFWSWGAWNLFYYPYLNQPWSLWGGLCLFMANTCWAGLMAYYGRKA